MQNNKYLLRRWLTQNSRKSINKACLLIMTSALCIGEIAICQSDIDNNKKIADIDQNSVSIIQSVSILISLLEYINKQKSSDMPIDSYYKTVFHLQYLLAQEASYPVYRDSQGVYHSGISASNRKKISNQIELLTAQYATLKNNAYYNSEDMKKLCEGNDMILSLDFILEWLNEYIMFEESRSPSPQT